MKYAIVNGLEWLCAVLDNLPGLVRTDERWRSARPCRRSQVGCAWGIATYAATLDARWGTEHWGGRWSK